MFYKAVAPSNIAFLKYWGKLSAQHQWPANDSLSMTLSNCVTTTKARTISSQGHRFFFNKNLINTNSSFSKKISKFLDYLSVCTGYSKKLEIYSENNFPSSAGIASSASGFGALTIASLAAWSQSSTLLDLEDQGYPLDKISELSRMGSGSSCRSIYQGYVDWEKNKSHEQQKVATVFTRDHWVLNDIIIIVSDEEKKTGSTQGHKKAWSSPLFSSRLSGILEKKKAMVDALSQKSMAKLGPLLEQEALEMHAVMLSSKSPINYMNERTQEYLCWIRKIRNHKKIPIYFTLDAGPNVHVLCEPKHHNKFLQELQFMLCGKETFIADQTGTGPVLERTQ